VIAMANNDLMTDLGLQSPPFILVARNPDPQFDIDRTTTAVRFENAMDAALWVANAEDAHRNLYIVRNPCVHGMLYRRRRDGLRYASGRWGNPPLIEDIEAVEWLVIDLDPAGADTQAACDHANRLLDRLPVSQHYRIFSGRGVQAALRLAEPAYSDDPQSFRAALELADRVNAWLRQEANPSLVTIDDVSNVNRFSRLCGTTNQKTGLRARWIVPPRPTAVIVSPDSTLRHVTSTHVRHWQRVVISDDLNHHVAEAVREIGRQPPLSHEFQHRASSGRDWAGRILDDRSARIISFASTAIRAGEPIPAIVSALLDPKNEILNEHWLKACRI